MTTALAVAGGVLAIGFVVGSLVRSVDGATLRRWRLSRRWDVPRLAREFIAAADEPLATLRGLTHMINAWERGARRPSERYWLLYLRVFPECAAAATASGDQDQAGELPGSAEAGAPGSANGVDPDDVRALAATVRALEQQVARFSSRLDKLSRLQFGEGQPHERSETGERHAGQPRARYRRSSWSPLWSVLLPSW